MLSQRMKWQLGLAVALLALLSGTAWAADDDKALRQRVLDLNLVTGDEPMAGAILTLADDKAGTPKLLAVAVQMAKEKDTPLNYNAAYILTRAALQLKDYDSAVAIDRVCIDQAKKVMSVEKLFQGYLVLISTYNRLGKIDDVIKACEEFEAIPEVKPASLEELSEAKKYNNLLANAKDVIVRQHLSLLVRQGKTDKALKVIEDLQKSSEPDDRTPLELKALVQSESGNYTGAIKTYDDMLQRVAKDIETVKKNTTANPKAKEIYLEELAKEGRRYRYLQSGAYTDAKQVEKAIGVLEGLVKEEPDNAGYNNDLGYIWADHDMKLDQTEKLIRKAIDEDTKKQIKNNPDKKPEEIKANAAYLDSLGWVLFKLKKYKDALPPLEDAVKGEEGQSIEIYDHLAEVQMKLGNKTAALDAWKKGIEVYKKSVEDGRRSKREDERKVEVEKKIKDNK